ncbi:MAG: hypothetical protein ACQKBW_12445 [Puniceicoccales bacterium]
MLTPISLKKPLLTTLPTLSLAALSLFSTGCQEQAKTAPEAPAAPKAEVAAPLAPTEATIATFVAADPLPALGDEELNNIYAGREKLPPPPVPTAEQIDKIAATLTTEPVGVGAPASNREVWDALAAQPEADFLMKCAEKALNDPIVPITKELWQSFEKTGSRLPYQEAANSRYERLRDLALGEALEYKGRFLPALEETLTAILDQGAWSIPSHNKSLDVFAGKEITIDLPSSQLAWTLATIDYWLADVLDPALHARVKSEIEHRVLGPYLKAVRTGKPFGWMLSPSNWTAVCGGSITGAALTLETDPKLRAEFIAIAEVILGRYIDSFSTEGISEEGLGYWTYGYGHFLYASEEIRKSTQGAIDLLDNEQVYRISQSPVTLELADGVYGAFGDQSATGSPDMRLVRFSAVRYGLPGADRSEFGVINRGARHSLGPHLYSLIIRSFGEDAPQVKNFNAADLSMDDPALRSWFPNSEQYICRPGPDAEKGMSIAIRISNNGEHHNHNDIGSYVVAYEGEPVLLDPGMERYSAKSFSKHRYDVSLNNSFGHPVPLVAGRMQKLGKDSYGEVISATAGDQTDTITIDMTQGYRSPGLEQLVRTLRYERPGKNNPGSIVVTDCVLNSQPEAFSTALVSRGNFEVLDASTVKVTYKGVSLYATIDTGGEPFAIAESPVLGFFKPEKPVAHRLGIYLTSPVKKACIAVTISPTPPAQK